MTYIIAEPCIDIKDLVRAGNSDRPDQ